MEDVVEMAYAQLKEKDRAISMFWAAINARDKLDSGLKEITAIVMRQRNGPEEVMEASRILSDRCTNERCERPEDRVNLLRCMLYLIQETLSNLKSNMSAPVLDINWPKEHCSADGNVTDEPKSANPPMSFQHPRTGQWWLDMPPKDNTVNEVCVTVELAAHIDAVNEMEVGATGRGRGSSSPLLWAEEEDGKGFAALDELVASVLAPILDDMDGPASVPPADSAII